MKIFIVFFIITSYIFSIGTHAGTIIKNQATLNYVINNINHDITSNTVIDLVDQLIDVKLLVKDINNTLTEPNTNDEYITYSITNRGNGLDKFEFWTIQSSSDDFDTTNIRMYLDDNNNSTFDVSDSLITTLELAPDETRTIFVVANIPNNLNKNDKSDITLHTKSTTGGSGQQGTIHVAKGINGVDAIDAQYGGQDQADATLEIISLEVMLDKSYTITNQYGTNEEITGALVTYKIAISLNEIGTINDINITDIISDKLLYKPNSIKLNNILLSDTQDADSGSIINDVVSVHIDQLSTPQSITFEAYIK